MALRRSYICMMPKTGQLSLFADAKPAALPPGVSYFPDVLTAQEEQDTVAAIAQLDLKPFDFHGFEGNRRVASFGWRYDFNGGGLQRTRSIPEFLEPLRRKAAETAGLSPSDLEHVLVTEYAPGAGIGWHRDRPQFGKVVAVSLLAPCRLRFRKKRGDTWERLSHIVEPRSAYVLDGEGRDNWEHSIPPMEELRYSLTFRTMRKRA
jgi:alkylated DNA repair dioxygenase AlkB